MTIQRDNPDKKAEEAHRTTEKGTAISVAAVGVFILLTYLMMFGIYMARV